MLLVSFNTRQTAEVSSSQWISPISRYAWFLPVDPVHRVALEVAADRGTNGREKGIFAKPREQPEALELVFYRVFEFGEAQLGSSFVQSGIQFGEGIGCGDLDASDRFCSNDQPMQRSWRFSRSFQNTRFEKLRIGKKEGGVPAE